MTYRKSGILMQTFEKIRSIRELNNWTQEDIAERLNMSISGYSKIERGETQPNLQRLQQIADILQVNILDLVSDQEGNICLINEGNNFQGGSQSIFHCNSQQHEIEKLKLVIQHKDELLAQQAQELETLRSVVKMLQHKYTS